MSTPVTNPVPLNQGDPLATPKKPFDGRTLADVVQFIRNLKVYITDTWLESLNQVSAAVAAAPTVINRVSEDNLSAAIPTTDLAAQSLASGLYEVRTYQQIRTVDGVSSSLQVTIGWTYLGIVQSETFTALTGDTTTTKLTGASKSFRSDQATPITYAAAYASNTPAKMHYSLDLTLSKVSS